MLRKYKILMFKMKLSYMAWSESIEFAELWFKAINETIRQQETEMYKGLKEMNKKI